MNHFLQQSRAAFRSLHGLDPCGSPEAGSFETARRNRVLGLWSGASVSEQWTAAIYGQALHTARLTEEAARIVDALHDSVEELRLVKGPVLAAQAWPLAGVRCFDDLDFRCAKRSLPALVDGLSALGYQAKAQNAQHRDNLWHFGWGLEFRHPDGRMVEVNHRMFPPHFPWPNRLTRRTPALWTSLMLNRTAVCCPSPALHLLLVCAHAAWHGWERLAWIVDLAGLLVLHPGVFSQAQALVCRSSFLNRTLSCGCRIASEIFGPLPGVEMNGADPLTAQAMELLVRDEPDVAVQMQREIHHELMTFRERTIYTIRRLTTPGDPDFTSWPLPRRLNSLYWLARPVRYFLERGS